MLVVENDLPAQLKLKPGNWSDTPMIEILFNDLLKEAKFLGDKTCDVDWIRHIISEEDLNAYIPLRSSDLKDMFCSKILYKQRNLIERCINKLKQSHHIETWYDTLPETSSSLSSWPQSDYG